MGRGWYQRKSVQMLGYPNQSSAPNPCRYTLRWSGTRGSWVRRSRASCKQRSANAEGKGAASFQRRVHCHCWLHPYFYGFKEPSARNYRPCFRENQPKRAFWACFRENWVYKFGHRNRSRGIDSANLCSLAGRCDKKGCCTPARQPGNRFLVSLKGSQIRTAQTVLRSIKIACFQGARGALTLQVKLLHFCLLSGTGSSLFFLKADKQISYLSFVCQIPTRLFCCLPLKPSLFCNQL
jgi:hypothetical protein